MDRQRPKDYLKTEMHGLNDGTSPEVAMDAYRVVAPQQTGDCPLRTRAFGR